MGEFVPLLDSIKNAPYAVAAVLIAKMILDYAKTMPIKNDYVRRSDCHSHIDSFKEEMNNNFGQVHEEIRSLRAVFISHVDK